MKSILILCSLGLLLPQGGSSSTPVCGCDGSWSANAPTQLECCSGQTGTPPLIVPSNQDAKNGRCQKDGNDCKEISNSQCTGSVDVQVVFPANGSSCNSVWVMGGTTYPVPTEIPATSATATLTVAADCKGTASNDKEVTFKVWCSDPGHGGVPSDAKYTFKLSCGACDNGIEEAGPAQPN